MICTGRCAGDSSLNVTATCTGADARRAVQAEYFLQAHRYAGRVVVKIIDADVRAAGHLTVRVGARLSSARRCAGCKRARSASGNGTRSRCSRRVTPLEPGTEPLIQTGRSSAASSLAGQSARSIASQGAHEFHARLQVRGSRDPRAAPRAPSWRMPSSIALTLCAPSGAARVCPPAPALPGAACAAQITAASRRIPAEALLRRDVAGE